MRGQESRQHCYATRFDNGVLLAWAQCHTSWLCASSALVVQNLLLHAAMHVRRTVVAAVDAIREPFVVQTKQVQDRGGQVLDAGSARLAPA